MCEEEECLRTTFGGFRKVWKGLRGGSWAILGASWSLLEVCCVLLCRVVVFLCCVVLCCVVLCCVVLFLLGVRACMCVTLRKVVLESTGRGRHPTWRACVHVRDFAKRVEKWSGGTGWQVPTGGGEE